MRGTSRMRERASTASALVAANRHITQRVLLLGATGNEPAYLHARSALDRIGVPYTTLIAATQELTPSMLTDDATSCHFSAVIVATSGLGYSDPVTGTWQSAFTPAEWQALADFEVACSAREVTWYGWPGAELGLAPLSAFEDTTAVEGELTAAGQALFRRVKSDALIPYRDSYGYRAQIVDAASTVSLVEAADGGVLVAQHTAPDGREALVSTVDSNPYLTHALLLEYDLIRWVTRGVFIGEKRAYMSPQIDDLLIADDLWIIGQGDTGAAQLRITGNDLAALAAWQASRIADLPPASTFITAVAYNAVGAQTSEYPDTTLLAAARGTPGDELLWVSHTWDHENMDAMSIWASRREITRNCTAGRGLALRGLDCSELVSPDMSGLTNPSAVFGMVSAGVKYVVSDTSHTAANFPSSPGDNPSFNVGRANPIDSRLYQIPRHPTSIFYNTNDPATQTDEYNTLYRSYYGRDLTYAEVLDKDSAFGLLYLLEGDIDPLMFHQTNLATFTDGAGNTRSLYADWIDTVLDKYLALSSAPVLSLPQAEIGRAMQARAALDQCGVTATKIESDTGASLELQTTGACVVPVTGISAPAAGTVSTYAGEATTSISMTAGGVVNIPLE